MGISRIGPRPGVEVFVKEGGTIAIARIDESFPSYAPIVDLHPGDVPKLIKLLKEAEAEATAQKAESEAALPSPRPANRSVS